MPLSSKPASRFECDHTAKRPATKKVRTCSGGGDLSGIFIGHLAEAGPIVERVEEFRIVQRVHRSVEEAKAVVVCADAAAVMD